jgi:sec-independent protein translocase protein TatA
MGSDVLIVVVVLLVIVLIWQGPKNLPKLGSALGKSIKDFRSEVSADETPAAPAPPASPEPPKDGSGG